MLQGRMQYLYKMRVASEKRGSPGPAAASNKGITPLTVRIVADVKMPSLKCSCNQAGKALKHCQDAVEPLDDQ